MEQIRELITQSPFLALFIVAIIYAFGEMVSTKTKAWIPSVFVIAILFIIGYWTIFPKNIVDLAGLGIPLSTPIAIIFCVIHMGSSISFDKLKKQWKTIVICLFGILGMIVFCLTIARLFVDSEYIIAGLPPLAGGIVSATMMQQAAIEAGFEKAAILAICMYVCQGFAGYPLTSILLKIEGKRLLKQYKKNNIVNNKNNDALKVENITEKEKRLIPKISDKYYSTSLSLAIMALIGFISVYLQDFSAKFLGVYKINSAVIGLILGIIFAEIGLIDRNTLKRNSCFNIFMFIVMLYIFSGLNNATPELLLEILTPMIIIIIVGVFGMAVFSIIIAKLLKVSIPMAFASSLTSLYGFPPNYILTEECVKSLATTEEEKQYLMDNMLPQMIVGGFVTVTITSVIIASIFTPLLFTIN